MSHKTICDSRAGVERQVLIGTAPFEGAGLWVTAVTLAGNQNSSSEEIDTASAGSAMDRLPGRASPGDIGCYYIPTRQESRQNP